MASGLSRTCGIFPTKQRSLGVSQGFFFPADPADEAQIARNSSQLGIVENSLNDAQHAHYHFFIFHSPFILPLFHHEQEGLNHHNSV